MQNPNPNYYRRNVLTGNRTAFMFETLTDYNKFITDVENVATGNARRGFNMLNQNNYIQNLIRQQGPRWFGTNNAQLVINEINTYLFLNQLDNFRNSFRNQTVNIDIIDIDQKKTIKFTEQELGIFSFDLASLGLIRVYEYFSPLLNKEVSGDFVVSEKDSQGNILFFYIGEKGIPEHEVKFNIQKGYYSEITGKSIDKKDLILQVNDNGDTVFICPEKIAIPKHIVNRVQKTNPDGSLKFATTYKKCFVYIPKVEKKLPRVDIIINSSFSKDVDARTEMIYSSMAAIALAEKLTQSNVDYNIIASYPARTAGAGISKEVYCFVKIKREGEPLDINKIATLLSDARFIRFQKFKGSFAIQYDASYDSNIDVPKIARTIIDLDSIKMAYIDFLLQQENPSDIAAGLNPDSKIVFSGALSEAQAVMQYNDTIRRISQLGTP